MKADILNCKKLFQKDVRYIIPAFQRPYVWNQEDQWEPLWNDVRNIAEEYLEQLQILGDKQAAAELGAGTHFLGAVVLQQQATATAELESRHVIDGQQRLTTLQLLLDAAQEVLEQDGWLKEAKQLRRLVLNEQDFAETNPDNVFKIWPTLIDQEAFRRAMSNDMTVNSFEDAPIVQAHEFFKLQIREWLGEALEIADRRRHALVTALMGLLEMVVIDLVPTDDANVIFETLNARGTPLLDSDLIKNSILHMSSQTGLNSDDVYREYWQGFDQAWWRTEVRQGRIVRPRIDVYLNYWLTMRTAEEIQSTRFFPTFRQYAEKATGSITRVVADIKQIGEAFRTLNTIADWSPEGSFLYRWRVMDAGVTTPVILWLLSNREVLTQEALYRALRVIESYLIRRMICRMTTKDYNKLFLELMRLLNESDVEMADDIILRFLTSQTADARLWPTDGHVEQALLSLPLYQLLTRGRLRTVLEGLEDVLRSPKTEEEHVPRGALTIEHIMPQGWREQWPMILGGQQDQIEATQMLDRVLHTIGNLTLVNGTLNPALSNSAWGVKRDAIAEHSVLQINKKLLEGAPTVWDEISIRQRSRYLAQLFKTVWPGPSS
ncbi:MAG: DUF262 domain-containing protein [Chloroflexi bacterium]|nr:DUF262 domain-containing protein [Chloroflexota bacterium]